MNKETNFKTMSNLDRARACINVLKGKAEFRISSIEDTVNKVPARVTYVENLKNKEESK
jgi:hypothetical protein